MANTNKAGTSKRQDSNDVSSAPPIDAPKTGLISCNKMEVRQKEVDNKRQRLRQTYSKGRHVPKHNARTFVTKVQIKSKKPAFEEDKKGFQVKQNIQNPRLSMDQKPKYKRESECGGDEIPAQQSTRLFQKNRIIASSDLDDSIDLLWTDNYLYETEKLKYLEINKLISFLSKRKRDSYKMPRRPTASFSRPTKGEIMLWIKSPSNKINTKTFPIHQDFIRPREKTCSLPVCPYSPSGNRTRQRKILENGRPTSVPAKHAKENKQYL